MMIYTRRSQHAVWLACMLAVSLATAQWSQAATVRINEVMASNGATIADEDGEFEDWIELYNYGAAPVDLGGWGLSDNFSNPFKWTFPAGTQIGTGEYVMVWASGKDRTSAPLYLPVDLVSAGAVWRYHDLGQDLGTAWRAPAYDDAGWSAGPAPLGYGPLDNYVTTTVAYGDNAQNKHITTYFRHEFMLDVVPVHPLELRLWLDDGAAVYLNGTEIARENLTNGPITYQTTTLTFVGQWPAWTVYSIDSAVLVTGRNVLAVEVHQQAPTSSDLAFNLQLLMLKQKTSLHANFALAAEGEEVLLTMPDGTRVDELPPTLLPRDITTGRVDGEGGRWYCFDVPTPGSANTATAYDGVAAPVVFSQAGGGVSSAFALTLSSATTGGVIRYTLNGDLPTQSSAVYSGPLTIDRSRQVRARMFAPGLVPSPAAGETYVLLAADVQSFSSDLPLVMIDCLDATTLPSVQPSQRGHVTFFEPGSDGRARLSSAPSLQTRAGLRRRGESTLRAIDRKPNLSVEAWRDDRDDERDIEPLGMPAESDWILYAPDDWDGALMRAQLGSVFTTGTGEYAYRWRIVEVFLRTGSGALSYTHYAGIYVLMESIRRGPHRVNIANLLPTHNQAPEITGGYIFRRDKDDPFIINFSAGTYELQYYRPRDPSPAQKAWLVSHINAFRSVLISSQANNPVTGYAAWIDVDSWVNVNLVMMYTANIDWPWFSTYYHKDRQGKIRCGPVWDFDRSMESRDVRDDNPEVWVPGGADFFALPWWSQLFSDPNFWQRYTDRWVELRRGLFSTTNIIGQVDALSAAMAEASVRNVAKWNGIFTYRFGGWGGEVANLTNWLIRRATWIDSRIPPTPQFGLAPGVVPNGALLALSAPTDTIYYTTNGSDPRAPGGTVAAAARAYNGPITITNNVTVCARVWDGRSWQGATNHVPWSSMARGNFLIAPLPAGFEPLIEQASAASFGLIGLFDHQGGGALTFSAHSSQSTNVAVSVMGSTLTLTPLARGNARVTVFGHDGAVARYTTSFDVIVYPQAHPAMNGAYVFHAWASNEPAGSFPLHMLFLQGTENDSTLTTRLEIAYHIPPNDASAEADAFFPYAAASRTRINGLGEDGISFINTGRGRDLGGALLALDTRNATSIQVAWVGGTILTNTRDYAIRLQYRIGPTGVFADVTDDLGQPVEYRRNVLNGHVAAMGPVFLPDTALGHEYVQLLWRYYRVAGTSGPRAQLRLDEILVTAIPEPVAAIGMVIALLVSRRRCWAHRGRSIDTKCRLQTTQNDNR